MVNEVRLSVRQEDGEPVFSTIGACQTSILGEAPGGRLMADLALMS